MDGTLHITYNLEKIWIKLNAYNGMSMVGTIKFMWNVHGQNIISNFTANKLIGTDRLTNGRIQIFQVHYQNVQWMELSSALQCVKIALRH